MKNKLLVISMVLPMVLSGCAYHASFKKPSFKKNSNQVSVEDFHVFYQDQLSRHDIFGTYPRLSLDKVFEGYTYYNSERKVYSERHYHFCDN